MKQATAANIHKVLVNFGAWVKDQPLQTRQEVAADINVMLDDILNEDGFGTEGQSDPRGDHRDE